MPTEKKTKEILGKINLNDIDRDEDLCWAVSDLWNLEKHLNIILNYLSEKEDEYSKKLYELASQLLTATREHRAKHLKRLTKLHEFGFWCCQKHLLGIMAQFGEVGAKDLSMGEEENARMDFETSKFAHDTIILINSFAKKYKKEQRDV